MSKPNFCGLLIIIFCLGFFTASMGLPIVLSWVGKDVVIQDKTFKALASQGCVMWSVEVDGKEMFYIGEPDNFGLVVTDDGKVVGYGCTSLGGGLGFPLDDHYLEIKVNGIAVNAPIKFREREDKKGGEV